MITEGEEEEKKEKMNELIVYLNIHIQCLITRKREKYISQL